MMIAIAMMDLKKMRVSDYKTEFNSDIPNLSLKRRRRLVSAKRLKCRKIKVLRGLLEKPHITFGESNPKKIRRETETGE